jgi:hypothetical protein
MPQSYSRVSPSYSYKGPSYSYKNGGKYNYYGGRRHYRRGYGFGFYPWVGFGAYAAYDSCYRLRRVWTPYGWQWRRVNVCGYPYDYDWDW